MEQRHAARSRGRVEVRVWLLERGLSLGVGHGASNAALFDLEAATAINAAPYRVTGVKVCFKEHGNRWFSREAKDRT